MASPTPPARTPLDADRAPAATEEPSASLAHAHLRASVAASADGMVGLSIDGRVLTWNRAAERLLAPATRLAAGARVSDAFEATAGFDDLLARAFGGEVVEVPRVDVAGADGRRGQVKLTLVPLHAGPEGEAAADGVPAGTALGCTLVLHDLSEELTSQAALAEGERRVQRAEALALTGTFVVDANDGSVQWSEGMYRIHGTEPADFVPSLPAYLGLVIDEDRPRVAALVARTLEGTLVPGIDYRVRRADGSHAWLYVAAEPLVDAEGRVLGLSGFCQDVNARVDSERALQQALTTEQAVSDELRRVDALKDEFLATVSHELRTPLTSIGGFTEILRQVAPEQADLIEPIARNAHEMHHLVEALLDQARLESGKVVIAPRRIELVPAVRSLLHEISPRPANVHVDIAEDSVIEMDADAFARVMGNLLSNAVKYGGGGTITVSSVAQETSVAVSVADEGPGIPDEHRTHLFDPFFQVPSAQRSARGSGFGLSIVRRYVEMHGGEVTCRSASGAGTTFTFRVPTRQPSRDPAHEGAPA